MTISWNETVALRRCLICYLPGIPSGRSRRCCRRERHVHDLESTNRLGPQVFVRDDIGTFHALRDEGGGTPNCGEVDGLVAHYGIDDLLAARTFADHRSLPQVEQARCVGVHTVARGWANRSDCIAGFGRCRASVVDDGAVDIDGRLLTRIKCLDKALVRRIACGQHDTAIEDLVARI